MYQFNNKDEVAAFVKENLVSSAEAAKMLNCSRANISDLVKRGKLAPAVEVSQTLLFWRDDIETRRAQAPKAGRPKNPES